MEEEKKQDGKLKETLRALKFIGFSISAGVIEVLSFTLLDTFTSWHYWPKYLIALVLSVLWNFTLNRKFTFQSANNVPKAMMLVALFYLVFTPTTTILGNYLAEDLHWNEYLVTGINMALNLSTEYLYDRFVVFRNSIDTNERAKKQKEMQ
jgi:putative flippase GtrA